MTRWNQWIWVVLVGLAPLTSGCLGDAKDKPAVSGPEKSSTAKTDKAIEDASEIGPNDSDDKVASPDSAETKTPPPAASAKTPAAKKPAVNKTPAVSKVVSAALGDTPLIPREQLFGNPDKASARISPDGESLSYLAPHNGVLNVFVGSPDKPDQARPVTADKMRGIRSYFWAYTSKHILYTQDTGGDEDWHIYCVNLETDETKDLTPLEKISADVEEISDKFPEEILVGINDRDPQYHDVYRVNIVSGERTLVQKNTDYSGFVFDDDFKLRFAEKMADDGSNVIYKPDKTGGFKEYERIPQEDTLTTHPLGFDKTGKRSYWLDSRGRDTGALTEIDLPSGKQEILAHNDRSDVGLVLSHPTEKNIQAVNFNYERSSWQVLDESIQPDIDYLQTVASGELQIPSRTQDDKKWIAAYLMDDGPVRYYLYDRPERKATFLFTNRQSLEGLPLCKMHPVVIRSRDGLNLVSYLTLPKESDPDNDGRPFTPLPLVLLVHGGPWARETWGYDPEHQLLANRGYAVLTVNFRGSTDFGKAFGNAGDKQWARKMHDDLLDAVGWAVDKQIAEPKLVAIMGGSYGGYATLVGLTLTPDKFACGVDIVGPSNLITLLKTIPPYWASALQMFKDRVGDPTTEDGRKLLEERSPLNFVDKIQRPLLIGQGANDPRVKQSEADQIVDAMQKKKIPVTYVLFPDEGHGFARPENSLAFYAVTEAFLAAHLGGRFQPIGQDFSGSTITVPTGADDVPGLTAAIKGKH